MPRKVKTQRRRQRRCLMAMRWTDPRRWTSCGDRLFCGFDHELCWARACDVLFIFGDRWVEDLHRGQNHVPLWLQMCSALDPIECFPLMASTGNVFEWRRVFDGCRAFRRARMLTLNIDLFNLKISAILGLIIYTTIAIIKKAKISLYLPDLDLEISRFFSRSLVRVATEDKVSGNSSQCNQTFLHCLRALTHIANWSRFAQIVQQVNRQWSMNLFEIFINWIYKVHHVLLFPIRTFDLR